MCVDVYLGRYLLCCGFKINVYYQFIVEFVVWEIYKTLTSS